MLASVAHLSGHFHADVQCSIPTVGIRTEARILTETVGEDFAAAGHLASYAGYPRRRHPLRDTNHFSRLTKT